MQRDEVKIVQDQRNWGMQLAANVTLLCCPPAALSLSNDTFVVFLMIVEKVIFSSKNCSVYVKPKEWLLGRAHKKTRGAVWS